MLEGNLQKLLGTDHELNLSEEDATWLGAVDKLDLLLYCMDQRSLGNRWMAHIEKRLRQWFARNAEWIPAEVANVVANYKAEPIMPIGA